MNDIYVWPLLFLGGNVLLVGLFLAAHLIVFNDASEHFDIDEDDQLAG